jgi:hypothetical protein
VGRAERAGLLVGARRQRAGTYAEVVRLVIAFARQVHPMRRLSSAVTRRSVKVSPPSGDARCPSRASASTVSSTRREFGFKTALGCHNYCVSFTATIMSVLFGVRIG